MSLKASELLSRILYRVGGCDQRWTPVCCVYYKGLERGGTGSLVERREGGGLSTLYCQTLRGRFSAVFPRNSCIFLMQCV